jgi:hypothetical protein
VHAHPGDHLEQVEHQVALAERVPEHRDRADLERHRPDPDQVRVDAIELAEAHPHPGRLLGHLETEQLLEREHEDQLVVLEGDVVDPLRVRDRLPPRLRLHVLLEAGVEVADDGAQAHDLLAVQIDDEPEDAVRGRVVRPEVDLEDVAGRGQLGRDGHDRRGRAGDARALVDARAAHDARVQASGELADRALERRRHYSSPENRTGSPPSG